MNNDRQIDELRDHLFDTLEQLKDKNNPMDLERAETIAKVGQVLVNSAKVEVDFMKNVGGKGSGFIPEAPKLRALPGKQGGKA